MRFYVAITDGNWFAHLSQGEQPEEVNFWQPSGNTTFRALQPGEPFLFKLHSPEDYIVGGGFFSYFSILPVSLAWSVFGRNNGAETEQEMRARIEHYRRTKPSPAEDYAIGCILLQSPFFFDRKVWIPARDWHKSIVRGRGYDTDAELGKWLWNRVQALIEAQRAQVEPARTVEEPATAYGQPQVVFPRLGQGAFRVIVTDAYNRRCAITQSPVLHVLEAAHIRPFAQGGSHSPQNGILLRQDFHTLFDRGYLTVTPEYRVEVSRRIREEFENGQEYYALHGKAISAPERGEMQPASEYLEWHNATVFRS